MVPVEKVFIIAFPGKRERKKDLFQERLKSVPLPENTPVEIVEIQENEPVDRIVNDKIILFKDWVKNGASMTSEGVRLAIAHWNIWQKAGREKNKSIIVLEEGFWSRANHYQVLITDEPWDMIYLGRFSRGSDVALESGGLVKPGYSSGSFAYMINQSGINKLLHSGYDKQLIPVDEFLTAMHSAHPRKELLSLFRGSLKVLAPMKNFVELDDKWSSLLETGTPSEGYKPIHTQLFETSGGLEQQWVANYLNAQLVAREFDLICDEPIDNVYSFPLFTPLFCREIIEEAEHYGLWTNYRHKDHPPIDIMLSSFGFNDIYTYMIKKYLYPLFYHKYKLQGEGWMKLNSQNFIVRYLAEHEGHLGLHNDGSYISMVVTLNTDYEGGGTFFPKFRKHLKHDQPGFATIHPGLIGYLHGARPVTKGRRYILASFFFPGTKHPFSEGTN